jgi:peptidoglycan/LPS O-acetylase OafA/YrhL
MDSNKRNYRPEIDGLRAISIILVILYHIKIKLFSGGFIGVDIFFVISGYLITNILNNELKLGTFSIIKFYERRVRRIIPALVFMAVGVSIISYRCFMPNQFKDFGEAISAMAIFLANILYYLQSNYFDTSADTKPLLHTWSLSVEEQFYIFLPIILYLVYKYAKNYLGKLFCLLLIASLLASGWAVAVNPSGAFYLIQYRAWELLAGSLLAMSPKVRDLQWNSITSQALSGLAFLLIVVPACFYNNRTAFPGFMAIPVILGAVIVIQLGPKGFMGRILSTPFFVFIGKISYPLYLWHWPLMITLRIYRGRSLVNFEYILCILTAFIFSIISFQFIEKPIRSRVIFRKPKTIFAVAVFFLVIFSQGSFLADKFDNFSYRFKTLGFNYFDINQYYLDQYTNCLKEYYSEDYLPCKLGVKTDNQPQFLLLGDSHAAAWTPAINDIATEFGLTGLQYTMGSCVPVIGFVVTNIEKIKQEACLEFNDGILDIVKQYNLKHVCISAVYGFYLDHYMEKTKIPEEYEQYVANYQSQFNDTITALLELGTTVWIVQGVPTYDIIVPEVLTKAKLTGKDIKTTFLDFKKYQKFYERTDKIINAIIRKNNKVKLLKIDPPLCDEDFCVSGDDKRSYYYDGTHLKGEAAIMLKDTFKPMMQTIANKK